MTERKALPEEPGVKRRSHLREYVIACLCDSAIAWEDLKTPKVVVDKILKTVASDAPKVIDSVKRQGLSGLLDLGSSILGHMAQRMVKPR